MITSPTTKGPSLSRQHWIHWGMNLICIVSLGVLFLPYVRSQPESLHSFALSLQDEQRILLTFIVSVIFVSTFFKLFSPRLSHLRYLSTHPPTWSAWLVGAIIICGIDLTVGVSKDIYNASWQEWLVYGLAPLLLCSLLFGLLRSVEESSNESSHSDLTSTASNDPQDWATLEPWLQTDAPAMQDILGTGNFVVAERLAQLLQDGTRSIGIVAPFGAGKSTVVKWGKQLIIKNNPRFILSEHSCWGLKPLLRQSKQC